MDIGSAVGRAKGVTEAQLRELPSYRASTEFTPLQRLVLDYAVAMTSTPVEVGKELFEALRAHLDDAQIVEITAVIDWANYRARFDHALGLEARGFSGGAFCVLPERAQ